MLGKVFHHWAHRAFPRNLCKCFSKLNSNRYERDNQNGENNVQLAFVDSRAAASLVLALTQVKTRQIPEFGSSVIIRQFSIRIIFGSHHWIFGAPWLIDIILSNSIAQSSTFLCHYRRQHHGTGYILCAALFLSPRWSPSSYLYLHVMVMIEMVISRPCLFPGG